MTVTIGAGNGDVVAVLAPEHGGRLASLRVHGRELLVTGGAGPLDWGLYPMAPFAGRIRHGCFTFEGRHHDLPLTMPPHAIHGTLLEREWTLVGASGMEVSLDPPWPFPGRVRHDVALSAESLTLQLTVEADAPMPVTIGWHPWFRRTIDRSETAALAFAAGHMYERDAEHIPTGRLVAVPAGPWDDCFTDLSPTPPTITWPGALELAIEHDASCLVVFTEPDHALCVEPQTGPPDAVNLGVAAVAAPDRPVRARMTLRWRAR